MTCTYEPSQVLVGVSRTAQLLAHIGEDGGFGDPQLPGFIPQTL